MPPPPPARRLVLVTGSTRSGTSMAAGTLSKLGLHVPQPVLAPNESNPAGFFESTWPLWFHRDLMDRAHVNHTDARPDSFDRMSATVSEADRGSLHGWLERVFLEDAQALVKDPRAIWLPGLWHETAGELAAETAFMAMVRHPAEVVASRRTYYGAHHRDGDTWRYQVHNLCIWINVNTGLELRTRGLPRVVVRYEDLLADWRHVVGRLLATIDLDVDPDTDRPETRAVDAFIDPGLRRHTPSWDGMRMPDRLVELAEGVWEAMGELADGRDGPAATARLDDLREAYAHELAIATAMAKDTAAVVNRAVQPAGGARGPGGSRRRDGLARRLVRRLVPHRIRAAIRERRRRQGGAPSNPTS